MIDIAIRYEDRQVQAHLRHVRTRALMQKGLRLRTLCAAATQWRVAPMGGLLGLDLAGAQAAAAGLGIEWPSAMPGLLIMEGVVLDAQSLEW